MTFKTIIGVLLPQRRMFNGNVDIWQFCFKLTDSILIPSTSKVQRQYSYERAIEKLSLKGEHFFDNINLELDKLNQDLMR